MDHGVAPPFSIALALYSLGYLRMDDAPAICTRALLDGLESPSLAALAGQPCQPYNAFERTDDFGRAIAELGMAVPSPSEAMRQLYRYWRQAALNGRLAALEAVRRIVGYLYLGTQAGAGDQHYAGDALGIEQLVGVYWEWHDSQEPIRSAAAQQAAQAELEARARAMLADIPDLPAA